MSEQTRILTSYIYALPKALIGAALAPPSVPSPTRMNGVVTGHHDGDSIYITTIVGIHKLVFQEQLYRALGIAARELSDPGGKEARDALISRPGMTVGSPVVLTSLGDDKYGGRLDAVVTYLGTDGVPHDLAADLIADQWAVPWNGKGVQPKAPWPRTVG